MTSPRARGSRASFGRTGGAAGRAAQLPLAHQVALTGSAPSDAGGATERGGRRAADRE